MMTQEADGSKRPRRGASSKGLSSTRLSSKSLPSPRNGSDPATGNGRPRSPRRLDPAVEKWFAGAAAAFPPARSSIIPLLQSAQTALGYLPADAMRAIARHVGVPAAVIEGVASFYAQFRFDEPGRHRVTVCSGTACYVRGSGKLMDDLKADLGIMPGKTTADGAITLESVSCFGACALAPVVVLDDKVLRQQTTASLRKAIETVSGKPSRAKRTVPNGNSAKRGGRR